MAQQLSPEVIRQRMIEWHNLKKLHSAQAKRIVFLETENKALKARIVVLEQENNTLRTELADIRYQLSEMKTLIFKKKRRASDFFKEDDTPPLPKPPRTPESYTRPIPAPETITNTVHHPCKEKKEGVPTRTRTYYVEDIPLALGMTITKHTVEQWYDQAKKVWVSAEPLPTKTVVLGDNIRVLVATLITIERLSYDQVQKLCMLLYSFPLSDGEIASILAHEATLLSPAEQALYTAIQHEESQHMDESRYDVQGETRYMWCLAGGESNDCVYRISVSRGKGNAETMYADSGGVLVSDDYGAYRTLAIHHQLCFAHLIRKFRDCAQCEHFSEAQKEEVRRTYIQIKTLYADVVSACADTDPQKHNATLSARFATVATLQEHDPKPVVRLKTTLMKNIPSYLTCLSFPSIALTNNLAERCLRHLVLKRKNSFGCKSERGAKTLSTLCSVLLSLYRKDPTSYLEKYMGLRRV